MVNGVWFVLQGDLIISIGANLGMHLYNLEHYYYYYFIHISFAQIWAWKDNI